MKNKHKWLTLSVLLIIVAALYINRAEIKAWTVLLSEGNLEDVVAAIRDFGIWGPIISMGLMVLQSFIAPIPAFLITCSNGLIFGAFWGVIISWTGAMLGAAGTFYVARFFGASFVQKLEKDGSLLKRVDDMSSIHGMRIVLVGRLLPFVSFDLVSYAAGLSKIKPRQFFIATGLGMLPATVVYVILGQRVLQHVQTINAIFIGFVILMAFSWILPKFKKARA